jgi:hypothetical protein
MTTKRTFNKFVQQLVASLPRPRAKRTGIQAEGLLKPKYNEFDERTSAQLKEQEFSGLRANDMWNRFEIWIYGNLHATLSYQEFFLNPDRLSLWYCEVFGLHELRWDEKTQADIERVRAKKEQLQGLGGGGTS